MSNVLKKTRKIYRQVIKIQLAALLILTVLLGFYQQHAGLSFLFGAAASFIPQLIFILFVFFRQTTQELTNKVNALYLGEGLKFIVTVVLTALVFIFYSEIRLGFYFGGFLSFLVLNMVLPMVLTARSKKAFVN